MRKFLSLLLALCLVVGMLPLAALAADGSIPLSKANTMTLKKFIEELVAAEKDGKISFDGKGVTVEWKPNEDVTTLEGVKIQRVQEPNAQYQLLSQVDKSLTISNVHFVYVPGPILAHQDGWNDETKDWTAEQIRNAEFQFLNTGDVTIENCTFEKVIVSPYGPGDVVETNEGRSFTVQDCTFSNVYNAYALKDIYPAAATITRNTFRNCSGAIYFEGSVPRQELTIKDNIFNNIDQYAASGKENTRSIIQFSKSCVLNGDTTGGTTGGTTLTISGNTIEENLVNDGKNDGQLSVIRQICNMGEVTIEGWTPGESFCVKIEADRTLTLPSMPNGQVDGITYSFVGWAKSTDYKGPTDLTKQNEFLKATASAVGASGSGTKYYAVWDAKTTVSGEKIWVDDGHESNRPASIEVQLLANGSPVSPPNTATVSANDSGEWVFTFANLTAFDADGKKFEYTVTEPEVPDNYTSSVTNNGNGSFTITNTYKEPVAPPPYNPGGDTPQLETEDHIQYLFGYPDRSFQPEASMTRAEAAQMFHNLLEKKSYEITKNFSDIPASGWYTTAVNTMGSLGVVSGYEDGTFRPNEPITRAEFVSMAVKFLESPQASTENKFTDVSAEDWFWNAVQAAVEEGWISGYEDGSFRPNRNITRAEVASIVNHVLERVADPDYAKNNKEKLNDFIDVTPTHWAYYHIVEATNWHDYTKRRDGKEYTETWSSSSFELR